MKNPNLVKIRQTIRDEILSVNEVTAVNNLQLIHDAQARTLAVCYEAVMDEETFRDEVSINA